MGKKKRSDLTEILDISIQLETAVGELYELYSRQYPEDQSFWWQLSLEESNHAALLESVKSYFRPEDILPLDSLTSNVEMLSKLLDRIGTLTAQQRRNPTSRYEALMIALQLEQSAGEQHFQMAVESADEQPGTQVIKKLVKDDRDHADRIEAYIGNVSEEKSNR